MRSFYASINEEEPSAAAAKAASMWPRPEGKHASFAAEPSPIMAEPTTPTQVAAQTETKIELPQITPTAAPAQRPIATFTAPAQSPAPTYTSPTQRPTATSTTYTQRPATTTESHASRTQRSSATSGPTSKAAVEANRRRNEKPKSFKNKQTHIAPDAARHMNTAHKKGFLAGVNRTTRIGIISAAVGGVVLLLTIFALITTVNVTINGIKTELSGTQKNVAGAVAVAQPMPKAGNLVAVDGSIIKVGGGSPFTALINGEKVTDERAGIPNEAVIEITNGEDIVEEFDLVYEDAPLSAHNEGTGAVHIVDYEKASVGKQEVQVGRISGARAAKITTEPTDITCKHFNINTGGEKVIALTFDDGPNATYTPQILDILKQYNVKATFFTIGNRIDKSCISITKRAFDEGHQISTHSFSHASGSGQGVNLSYMSAEEQVAEITKGYEAIEAATGEKASRVIRTPGGNFPPTVIANLAPHISSEIGWNVDTLDWKKPGAAAITSQICSAKPGNIVLMHDGGGDRSQTVAAVAQAIPRLISSGYRFVTVDELLSMHQG